MYEYSREGHPHAMTLLAALRRRLPIALATCIIVFSALTYLIFSLKPLYASKTTLILPFTPISELTSRNDNRSSPQSDPLIVHSYVQIMQDDGICLQIIQQLGLAEKAEFDPQPGALLLFARPWQTRLLGGIAQPDAKLSQLDRVLQIYQKRLKVYNDGRSLAVDVSFQAEDPRLAATVANAHAEAYRAAQIQYRRHEAETKTLWMEQQVQQSAKDLRAAQVALQLHAPTNSMTSYYAAEDSADFKFHQAVLKSKQEVYESLLNRQQVMLAEQHYDGSDTRIISPARIAVRPSFPNKPLLGTVALMAALLLGVGLAWAVDLLVLRHRKVGDRLHDLNLEQLAFIELPRVPILPFMRRRLQRLRLALYWEKIREIRSFLDPWQSKGIVVAMTSAGPKEASSLLAVSLARASAASGLQTLLVDFDLRHPGTHTYFGMNLSDSGGLTACLTDEVALRESVRPVPNISSLSLLGSSAQDRCDVDLLAGPGIKETLSKLRREFKVIIIDTPTIGVVCDALVIADLADQIVLVSGESASAIDELSQAVRTLRRRSAVLLGVIVTSDRQASAASCRALGGYIVRDRLSQIHPRSARREKPRREAHAPIGVLHPAE